MKYDLFFACLDHEPCGRASGALVATNAAAVCLAEGFEVTLAAAPSPDFVIGQIVSISDGSKTAYCRVVKRTTSPNQTVTLLPLQTTKDSADVIGYTFPNPSIIAGAAPQDAFSLVIDLTDAPDGEYNYALVACCSVVGGSALDVAVRMLVNSLVDDPLGGAGSSETELARWKLNSTSSEHPFNAVELVSLQAGQRYEFRLLPSSINAASVEIRNPRLLAIRYDEITEGSQISEVSTTSTAFVPVVSLPALAAGTYLILASWLLQCSQTGTGADARLRVMRVTDASTPGLHIVSPLATTDYVSGGFFGVITLNAGEVLALQHSVGAAGPTSRVKQARLMALPLPPAFAAMSFVNRPSGTTSGLTPEAWNDLVDTGDISFEAGTYVEVIQHSNPMEFELRPLWGSPGLNFHLASSVVEPERRGRVFSESPGSAGTRQYCNFFFHRCRRPSGTGRNTLQTRPASGVTSQTFNAVRFSFLREKPTPPVKYDTPYTFAAELEAGFVYSKWTSVGSDTWRKHLPSTALVTRVVVNGVDYQKAASNPPGLAHRYYWDLSTRELTIKMGPGESPSDPGRTVLVCEPILAGRDPEVFTDDDGVARPYDAILIDPPSVEETLDIRAQGTEVGSTYGNIRLAHLKDPQRRSAHFDGMRIRVRRGRRGVHKTLKEAPPLLSAQMGRRRIDPKKGQVTIAIQDRSLVLNRPIAETTVPVYSGATQRESWLVPVIYGTMRRVIARRTTNNGAGSNTFKVAAHACKNIGVLLPNGTFQAKAYKDGTEETPSVASITVDLNNGQFTVPATDTDHWQLDTLYVDVQGVTDNGLSTGNLIDSPGAIARHLLVTYGGFSPTQLVEASFRLMDRRWRTRRKITGPVPLPVKVGLVITSQKIKDALNELARAFSYWMETRAGRLKLGVPDHSAANLLDINSGFERDASSIWPWRYGGYASGTLTNAIKYQGTRALQVSNGQTITIPRPYGDLRRTVLLPRPGKYAVTAVVSLQNGEGNAVRLGFVSPDDGMLRQLSPAAQVSSEQWVRISGVFEVDEGSAGTGVVMLLPYEPEGHDGDLPDTTNLQFDFDASSISAQNGDRVITWPNSGPAGGSITVAGAHPPFPNASTPRYVSSAVAGHPALAFDEIDDAMGNIAFPTFPRTVILVYAYRSAVSRPARVISDAAAPSNWWIGPHNGTHRARVATSGGSDVFIPTGGSGPTVDPYQTVVVTYRQTTAQFAQLFVNGVLIGQVSGTTLANPTNLALGNVGSAGGPLYIAKVLVFNAALGVQRRTAWEGYLMRRYGILPVSVNVDNAEMYHVKAHVEPVSDKDPHGLNAEVLEIDVRPDHFYEAGVVFNPNLADRTKDLQVIRNDSQARGLISSYNPEASEARGANPPAGRVEIRDLIVSGATEDEGVESAAGIANAIPLWFGRQREVVRLSVKGLTEYPELGDRIFVGKIEGVPRTPDDYPIHIVTRIDDENAPPSEVILETEREIDPVADRHEISPTELPLGAIVITTASSCPTDYEEVTQLRGLYVAGATVPNLSALFGALHHTHTLDHTHPLPAHNHGSSTVQGGVTGLPQANPYDLSDVAAVYRTRMGPIPHVWINVADADHVHSATSVPHASASGTSSQQVGSLATFKGANDITHRRVLFCRRTGKTQSTISTSIIVGYMGAAAPTGWQICDGTNGGAGAKPDLRGFALRGAHPGSTGVSNRSISANHTQSDTDNGGLGGWIVCDLDGINLFDRVTVTDGTKTYHGIVALIDGANSRFALTPSHETGDSPDGSVYLSSNTTISTDSSEVGVTRTTSTHMHVRSGNDGTGAVPAHLHTAPHQHVGTTGSPTIGGSVATVQTTLPSSSSDPRIIYPTLICAGPNHVHPLTRVTLPTDTSSTSAQAAPTHGGSITSAAQNNPPKFTLPFISPTNGSQTAIPAGTVIFWDQSICPLGFEPVDQANGRIIVGAPAGQGPMSDDGGHSHGVNFAAHAFPHQHGGTVATTTDPDTLPTPPDQFLTSGAPLEDFFASGVAQGSEGQIYGGHVHPITLSIAQQDPGLSAVTGSQTGVAVGPQTMPVHRRLRLCVKS